MKDSISLKVMMNPIVTKSQIISPTPNKSRTPSNKSSSTTTTNYLSAKKESSIHQNKRRSKYKKKQSSPHLPSTFSSSSTSSTTSSSDPWKCHWLNVVCDSTLDSFKAYHIEFQWLACEGVRVKELAHSLYRRASQFGLRIAQVPEYARSSNLYIHPFLIHL